MRRVDLQRLLDTVPEDAEFMVSDMSEDMCENIRLVAAGAWRHPNDRPGQWQDESCRQDEMTRSVYVFAPDWDAER